MSFDLVAYEKLKSNIVEAVATLVKHHKKEAVDEIPTERRVQAQVLLKTIELCDKIKASTDEGRKKQATILNAAVYYIHLQIEETYKRTSPTNSNFYNSLTTSLELSRDNTPSQNELLDLFTALASFQREHIFIDSDARKGFLPTQVFNIKDYCIVADNLALTKIHQQLDLKIVEDAQALHIKAHAKPKGLLGSFFGSSATAEPTPATEDKKPAHV